MLTRFIFTFNGSSWLLLQLDSPKCAAFILLWVQSTSSLTPHLLPRLVAQHEASLVDLLTTFTFGLVDFSISERKKVGIYHMNLDSGFKSMVNKNLFKWTKQLLPSQVEQLIRAERNIEKAVLIFDSATAEYSNGFKHDQNTFRLLVSKLVSANQFRSAEAILDRMKEEKCDMTEDIFLNIFRAYGRVHKPLDAIRVFYKMEQYQCIPTQKSYIAVFAILVEENQLKMALRFYRYMREMGNPPNLVSINLLIKALCQNSETTTAAIKIFRELPNRGFKPDAYTYGTLINGLCKQGKIVEAKELFKEMQAQGCSPSVVTYTSLMHGLCQSNSIAEATGLLEDMKSKNIEPNVFTYSCLMNGLCKNGHSSRAVELMEIMIKKRLAPNMVTYSTLISGLCKEGRVEGALEILDRMKVEGLKPDAGLYGKIIVCFCDVSRFEEAANLLDEMVLGGIRPSRLTWGLHCRIHNMVVYGLCASGHANRGFTLYRSMRTRGILINMENFDILVKYFCEEGGFEKVGKIVDDMVVDGCVPEKETWRGWVKTVVDQNKVSADVQLLQHELVNLGVRSNCLSESIV